MIASYLVHAIKNGAVAAVLGPYSSKSAALADAQELADEMAGRAQVYVVPREPASMLAPHQRVNGADRHRWRMKATRTGAPLRRPYLDTRQGRYQLQRHDSGYSVTFTPFADPADKTLFSGSEVVLHTNGKSYPVHRRSIRHSRLTMPQAKALAVEYDRALEMDPERRDNPRARVRCTTLEPTQRRVFVIDGERRGYRLLSSHDSPEAAQEAAEAARSLYPYVRVQTFEEGSGVYVRGRKLTAKKKTTKKKTTKTKKTKTKKTPTEARELEEIRDEIRALYDEANRIKVDGKTSLMRELMPLIRRQAFVQSKKAQTIRELQEIRTAARGILSQIQANVAAMLAAEAQDHGADLSPDGPSNQSIRLAEREIADAITYGTLTAEAGDPDGVAGATETIKQAARVLQQYGGPPFDTGERLAKQKAQEMIQPFTNLLFQTLEAQRKAEQRQALPPLTTPPMSDDPRYGEGAIWFESTESELAKAPYFDAAPELFRAVQEMGSLLQEAERLILDSGDYGRVLSNGNKVKAQLKALNPQLTTDDQRAIFDQIRQGFGRWIKFLSNQRRKHKKKRREEIDAIGAEDRLLKGQGFSAGYVLLPDKKSLYAQLPKGKLKNAIGRFFKAQEKAIEERDLSIGRKGFDRFFDWLWKQYQLGTEQGISDYERGEALRPAFLRVVEDTRAGIRRERGYDIKQLEQTERDRRIDLGRYGRDIEDGKTGTRRNPRYSPPKMRKPNAQELAILRGITKGIARAHGIRLSVRQGSGSLRGGVIVQSRTMDPEARLELLDAMEAAGFESGMAAMNKDGNFAGYRRLSQDWNHGNIDFWVKTVIK